ncbi:hypothetical protein [Sulfurimonas sp.]|uniref:hypothetical protein n=1 Tax=Sulfurimonas sp. TaxID=2022749 RepID=UPI003568DBC4
MNVKITDLDFNVIGKTFIPSIGFYDAMILGDFFESDINATDDRILVNLNGKNCPVDEPAGIKVMEMAFDATISNSKRANCIMTASYHKGDYLDAVTPTETRCNSDFQTHKRFKLNMLPTMVEAGDDNNDPTTDAQIIAFCGDCGDGNYTWMKGNEDAFATVTSLDLATWTSSHLFNIDKIEDVLNLGLNYIVEIGDISIFPAASPELTIGSSLEIVVSDNVTVIITASITPMAPVVVTDSSSSDSSSIFSTVDNLSMLAMIFGFLTIGGLIVRRKLVN